MNRRYLLLAMLVSLVALPPALVALSQRLDTGKLGREQRVIRILEDYRKQGLFVPNVLGTARDEYVLPKSFKFPYAEREAVRSFLEHNIAAQENLSKVHEAQLLQLVTHELLGVGKGKEYDGKVQFNQPPKQGYINVYFLKSDPQHLASHFNDNCAYIGILNTIICDANFLRRQFAGIENYQHFYAIELFDLKAGNWKDSAAMRQVIIQNLKTYFLMWLLGHEMGHVVLHRAYAESHRNQLHFHDFSYDQRELEADRFVSDTIAQSVEWGGAFCNLMSELMDHLYLDIAMIEYPRNVKDGRFLGAETIEDSALLDRFPITVTYTKYRMPLIVRITRLLTTLVKDKPGIDDSGYFFRVRSSIVLKDGSVRNSQVLTFLLLGTLLAVLGLWWMVRSQRVTARPESPR